MFKKFLIEEDGVELIEWLAVLAAAIGLIAVVVKASGGMKDKMSNIAGKL